MFEVFNTYTWIYNVPIVFKIYYFVIIIRYYGYILYSILMYINKHIADSETSWNTKFKYYDCSHLVRSVLVLNFFHCSLLTLSAVYCCEYIRDIHVFVIIFILSWIYLSTKLKEVIYYDNILHIFTLNIEV